LLFSGQSLFSGQIFSDPSVKYLPVRLCVLPYELCLRPITLAINFSNNCRLNSETMVCRDLLQSESPSGKCAKLHTLISAELPRHDHSIIACSRHIYMDVVLRAHSVRDEPRIQRNANGEVATDVESVSTSRSTNSDTGFGICRL